MSVLYQCHIPTVYRAAERQEFCHVIIVNENLFSADPPGKIKIVFFVRSAMEAQLTHHLLVGSVEALCLIPSSHNPTRFTSTSEVTSPVFGMGLMSHGLLLLMVSFLLGNLQLEVDAINPK